MSLVTRWLSSCIDWAAGWTPGGPWLKSCLFLADEWSHQMLFADSCVVSELPVLAPPSPHSDLVRHAAAGCSLIGQQLTLLLLLQLRPDLQLTEEEQKLLSQEGVSLPNNLPLTKVHLRSSCAPVLLLLVVRRRETRCANRWLCCVALRSRLRRRS